MSICIHMCLHACMGIYYMKRYKASKQATTTTTMPTTNETHLVNTFFYDRDRFRATGPAHQAPQVPRPKKIYWRGFEGICGNLRDLRLRGNGEAGNKEKKLTEKAHVQCSPKLEWVSSKGSAIAVTVRSYST